jgi:hypothetical protein
MRADLVLNLAQPGEAFATIPFIRPRDMRIMGRSPWRTTKHVHLQGGPYARNGWGDFYESFVVDDIESARYVSWYYNLLAQCYVNGITTIELQKIMAVDPVADFVRTFYLATKQPHHPALVLVHNNIEAVFGAHLRFDNDKVHWVVDKRYVGLMGRIATLGVFLATAYTIPGFMIGWVWREPGKPWRRSRSWFTRHYDPTSNFLDTCIFSVPLVGENWTIAKLYDTNVYVPREVRHVTENQIPSEGWSPRPGRLAIRSGPKDKTTATWFG